VAVAIYLIFKNLVKIQLPNPTDMFVSCLSLNQYMFILNIFHSFDERFVVIPVETLGLTTVNRVQNPTSLYNYYKVL